MILCRGIFLFPVIHCTVLSRITLPDTLVSIDDFCFEDCTKLGSLKIPASLTNIGYDAFIHCENLLLDVSENTYAAEYAKANGLVTSFKDSSLYFWYLIGIGTLIAVTLAFICLLIYYAWLRRHPEKNPNIFIFRVFGKIYSALSKAYHFIVKWILIILSFIIYWITFAVKWVINKLPKRKAKKKNSQSSETD